MANRSRYMSGVQFSVSQIRYSPNSSPKSSCSRQFQWGNLEKRNWRTQSRNGQNKSRKSKTQKSKSNSFNIRFVFFIFKLFLLINFSNWFFLVRLAFNLNLIGQEPHLESIILSTRPRLFIDNLKWNPSVTNF